MPEAMEMPPVEQAVHQQQAVEMPAEVTLVEEELAAPQEALPQKRYEYTELDLAIIRAAHDFIRSNLPAATWNFGYEPKFPAHFDADLEAIEGLAERNGYQLYYLTARKTYPVLCLGEMPGSGVMFAVFKEGALEFFHLTPEETANALDKRRLSPKKATLAGLTRPNRPLN